MYDCVRLRCTKVLVTLVIGLGLSVVVQGGDPVPYDFTGYSVSEGSLVATFGTKVAELDAKDYGFDFSEGTPGHGLRNLNIITQVFVATQPVTIGVGVNGTIELLPGDYTFAYTLDYTELFGFTDPNSTVIDFQLARVVVLGETSNPGEMMALGEITAGGYNTDPGFGEGDAGTPPFKAYPAGFDGTEFNLGPTFMAGHAEYDWGEDGEEEGVLPGTKAMVFMFTTSDVDVWQVGWGSANGEGKNTLERQEIGDTGEGGSIFGGPKGVANIPLLIPVVPEPASLFSLLLIGNLFVLTRRRKKNENTVRK